MLDETTLEELIRRATTAGVLRSNQTEGKRLIEHLLANGFSYQGAALQRPAERKKAHTIDRNGTRLA